MGIGKTVISTVQVTARMNQTAPTDPKGQGRGKQRLLAVVTALVLGGWGWGRGLGDSVAWGQAAPPEVADVITQVETAANAQDVAGVLALMAADFTHGDGFDRAQYGDTLAAVWATYPELRYQVEILSWEAVPEGFVVETETTMTGLHREGDRTFTLTATVRSRQIITQGQIQSQEILAERSQLVAGANPPTVTIQLPDTVRSNRRFSFDAIVQEPLGNRILLGRAIDEGVTSEDFLTPRPISLSALSAGGLFKIGRTGETPDQRWISAVIVSNGGFVINTRRLIVTD